MIETERNTPVLEALRARRSIPKVRDQQPDRALIERMIEAAGYAPNHHATQPWRFIVLAGEERRRLGDIMAESLRQRQEEAGTFDEAAIEKARAKPLRAPVIVVSAAVPSNAPKVIEIEEVAATAAATENMLLAAQALGLGAMWRTGAPAYDPAVKRFLGLPEPAHIVGFIYVGYPDLPNLPPRDRDALSRATWRGWDEPSAS
jgi:nitroreductase